MCLINLEEGLVTISGSERVPLKESIALGRKMLADEAFAIRAAQLLAQIDNRERRSRR